MVQKAEEEDETKTPRFFFLSVRCVCPEPILPKSVACLIPKLHTVTQERGASFCLAA
jgi:hypothetical protein